MQSLMTIWELERMTSIKVSSLRKMVASKKIPFVKIGRLVRFNPEDIARWVEGLAFVTPQKSCTSCGVTRNEQNEELDFGGGA